jgi:acetyl esterase/lipase
MFRHMSLWLLIPAIVLCFISLWIVLPPLHAGLLAFAVGAPELSPWLLVASVAVGALAFPAADVNIAARAAFGLAAVSAVLCASPLVRAPLLLRAFDRSMEQRLGIDYERLIPADARRSLRPHAIAAADFVRGVGGGTARVQRGVEFARPGGVALTLDVYEPPSGSAAGVGAGPGSSRVEGLHPILLQLYGGAWQRGSPEDNASFASYFASKGYLVVAVDYRHAPEFRWPAQIQDVRAALGWVIAHAGEYNGDRRRIAMIGRSAGAQLALVAAYQAGMPLVRAVVSYYGPVDLAEGWRVPPRPDPLDIRKILETYLGGTPDNVPVAYHDASPVTYVGRRAPPTLLVYGARDHIVEARFGRELDERLRRAGAPSVLLEIPWAEHAFDVLPNGLSGQISLFYTERFLAWAMNRAG